MSREHPCIAKVNKALAERGDRLQWAMTLDGNTPILLATEKIPLLPGRPSLLTAKYCPFCGKRMDLPAPTKPRGKR